MAQSEGERGRGRELWLKNNCRIGGELQEIRIENEQIEFNKYKEAQPSLSLQLISACVYVVVSALYSCPLLSAEHEREEKKLVFEFFVGLLDGGVSASSFFHTCGHGGSFAVEVAVFSLYLSNHLSSSLPSLQRNATVGLRELSTCA